MRTTIDINDSLLREAWRMIKPKSKRHLIELSLEGLIRREHLKRLASRVGHTPMMRRAELLRQRRRG